MVWESFVLARGRSLIVLVGVTLSMATVTARADTLALNATALADCPACGTATGGAQVVNYVEQLAPQTLSFSPSDSATPPSEGWATSATNMATAEADLAGTASGTTSAAADAVVSTTELIEVGAGAIPELCSPGFLCPAALAVAAFTGGVVIGTGVKALFERFFGGDDNNVDTSVTQEQWLRNNGSSDIHVANSATAVVHPGEYYLTYRQYGQQWNYSWTGGVVIPQCNFGPAPPSNTIVRTGTTTGRCSSNPAQPVAAYARTPSMFLSHKSPLVPASAADTTGATTYAAPAAPSRSAFATAATSALNEPNNHEFRLWLQHQLDPRCSPDPTSATVVVPDRLAGESTAAFVSCLENLGLEVSGHTVAAWAADLDASAGAVLAVDHAGESKPVGSRIDVAENPDPLPVAQVASSDTDEDDDGCDLGATKGTDPGPGHDPFSSYIGSYTDPTDPTNFLTIDDGPTYLLWGTTIGPTWGGWGFRHIYAKHGFGPDDVAATRAALAAPLGPPTPSAGTEAVDRWVYVGLDLYFSASGAPCRRLVVVERGKIEADQTPDQTGIWTSYGTNATL